MIISDVPVFVMTFITGFLTVFAVNLTLTEVFRRRQQIQQAVLQEQASNQRRDEIKRKAELQRSTLLAASQSERLEDLADEAHQQSLRDVSLKTQLKQMIEQSGLTLTLPGLMARAVFAAVIAGAPVFLVVNSPLMALGAAAAAALMPFAYVEFKRRQRLDKLRQQLPDAFDLMGRVMRAGQTIPQAMQAVSQEFDVPLAYEFGYCSEQQNLGIPPHVALRELGRRTGLLEIQIFVMSLLIHRQVGGNVADLLENLAHVVRERFRLRGKVSALTAEGRLQAIILLALPIVVWFGILAANREYALKLLDHPQLVLGTLGGMTVGALWIRKIVNFDF